jgi:hypothetical protein
VKSDFLFQQKRVLIRQDEQPDPLDVRKEVVPANVVFGKISSIGKMRSVWEISGLEERLVKLNKEGHSASQVARVLNYEFEIKLTRNSVISKLQRVDKIKLPIRKKVVQCRPINFLKIESVAVPKPKGDVSEGCRFIFGDASQRNFCGASSKGNWCDYHHNIVYRKEVGGKAR